MTTPYATQKSQHCLGSSNTITTMSNPLLPTSKSITHVSNALLTHKPLSTHFKYPEAFTSIANFGVIHYDTASGLDFVNLIYCDTSARDAECNLQITLCGDDTNAHDEGTISNGTWTNPNGVRTNPEQVSGNPNSAITTSTRENEVHTLDPLCTLLPQGTVTSYVDSIAVDEGLLPKHTCMGF